MSPYAQQQTDMLPMQVYSSVIQRGLAGLEKTKLSFFVCDVDVYQILEINLINFSYIFSFFTIVDIIKL